MVSELQLHSANNNAEMFRGICCLYCRRVNSVVTLSMCRGERTCPVYILHFAERYNFAIGTARVGETDNKVYSGEGVGGEDVKLASRTTYCTLDNRPFSSRP